MNVWLVDPWDALPGELGFERGQQISAHLLSRGHSVVWWMGTFSHAEKKQRASECVSLDGLKVKMLRTPGYCRNTGLARMLNIACFALKFTLVRGHAMSADVILVSGPIFFCEPVLLYIATVKRIPIVFEFRDLWPESIVASAPRGRRWLYRLALLPFALGRKLVFARCAGIVGLNQTYLAIALREAGSEIQPLNAVAYPSPSWGAAKSRSCTRLPEKGEEIWVVSGGTLGASYDHETLLTAALALRDTHPRLRFFLTGIGPHLASIQQAVQKRSLSNVSCLGALPKNGFEALLAQCDIGLALYRLFSPVVFPTKLVDYLLAGLPVVASVRGEGAELIEKNGAGVAVPSENPTALCEALVALVTDGAKRAQMKHAACLLGAEFKGEKQIAKLVQVVEECGAKRLKHSPENIEEQRF